MPFKNKEDLYAAQKKYRERKKGEAKKKDKVLFETGTTFYKIPVQAKSKDLYISDGKIIDVDLFLKRQKQNRETVEKIKAFPEFKKLSSEEQVKIEKSLYAVLAAYDAQIDEKIVETEQYLKMKLDAVFQTSLETIRKAEQFKQILQEEKQGKKP